MRATPSRRSAAGAPRAGAGLRRGVRAGGSAGTAASALHTSGTAGRGAGRPGCGSACETLAGRWRSCRTACAAARREPLHLWTSRPHLLDDRVRAIEKYFEVPYDRGPMGKLSSLVLISSLAACGGGGGSKPDAPVHTDSGPMIDAPVETLGPPPALAIACTDSLADVYTLPSGLPTMDDSHRGDV